MDSTQLDSLINYTMNTYHIPGLAALINTKEDGIIWKRNYGYANIPLNQPVEDSTLFIIASISKTIVATAIMQFWEADSFDLDDNINDYIDDFQIHIPNHYNDTVTIRMIMTHTSSIENNGNVMDPLTICGDSPISLDTFLINYFTPGGSYYNSDLNFINATPGTVWQYCDVAVCILAYLVEKFSGMSFDQYCRENIFNPLEMNKTSWFLEGLDTTAIATPYLWQGGQYIPYCHYGHPLYPVGQLRTNKIELEHFFSAYMNWGRYNGATILDSATVDLILTDQLGFPIRLGNQGLIWLQSNYFNGRWPWGHEGAWLGCTTAMFFQQEEERGIILFVNSFPNDPEYFYLLNILCDYANLYGEIYALNPSVDKSYARKTIDSVLFRTKFSNIYNHPFIPHIIYADLDSTQIDSLSLFDDGLHGDSLSNDGIYGNYIPPQQNENFYSLGVSTIDNQTNKYFNTPDLCRFTTAGPLTVDSIKVYQNSSTLFTLRPYVKNNGNNLTLTGAKIRLYCDDPWVLSIGSGYAPLPDIIPGTTVGSSTEITIRTIDSLFTGYFNLRAEIIVDGYKYWSEDSLQVVVGVEEELNETPKEFLLAQNYPNPLNPSTKIKYSIPNSSQVTLKIFNTLGEELATLVNEEKVVGTYEVNWNGANLPSGVYFYRLQAGEFTSTKKMILLR